MLSLLIVTAFVAFANYVLGYQKIAGRLQDLISMPFAFAVVASGFYENSVVRTLAIAVANHHYDAAAVISIMCAALYLGVVSLIFLVLGNMSNPGRLLNETATKY